ncbi:MAG: hypothetical protein OHK0023_08310 [Anaerolineae bacterium]
MWQTIVKQSSGEGQREACAVWIGEIAAECDGVFGKPAVRRSWVSDPPTGFLLTHQPSGRYYLATLPTVWTVVIFEE